MTGSTSKANSLQAMLDRQSQAALETRVELEPTINQETPFT